MNKKFISVFMMGAATLAPLSTLVSCSDYDDDINNLQAQIDASGVNLKEEVSKLQKLLDECKAAAEKADADLEQAIKNATNDAKGYADIQAEQAKQAAIAALQAQLSQAIADLENGAIADAKARAEQAYNLAEQTSKLANSNKAELEKLAKELETVNTDLQKAIEALQTRMTAAEAAIAEVKTQAAENKAQLTTLETTLNALKASNETAHKALSDKDDELKNLIEANQTEIEGKLANEVSAINTKLGEVNTAISALEGRVGKNESDIAGNKQDIAGIKQDIADNIKPKLNELSQEISSLKTEIQNINEYLNILRKNLNNLITGLIYQASYVDMVKAKVGSDPGTIPNKTLISQDNKTVYFPYKDAAGVQTLNVGSWNVEEIIGNIYYTINPTDVNFAGVSTVLLENSVGIMPDVTVSDPQAAERKKPLGRRSTETPAPANGLYQSTLTSNNLTQNVDYSELGNLALFTSYNLINRDGSLDEKKVYSKYELSLSIADQSSSSAYAYEMHPVTTGTTANGVALFEVAPKADMRGEIELLPKLDEDGFEIQPSTGKVYRKYVEITAVKSSRGDNLGQDAIDAIVNANGGVLNKVLIEGNENFSSIDVNVPDSYTSGNQTKSLIGATVTFRYFTQLYNGKISATTKEVCFVKPLFEEKGVEIKHTPYQRAVNDTKNGLDANSKTKFQEQAICITDAAIHQLWADNTAKIEIEAKGGLKIQKVEFWKGTENNQDWTQTQAVAKVEMNEGSRAFSARLSKDEVRSIKNMTITYDPSKNNVEQKYELVMRSLDENGNLVSRLPIYFTMLYKNDFSLVKPGAAYFVNANGEINENLNAEELRKGDYTLRAWAIDNSNGYAEYSIYSAFIAPFSNNDNTRMCFELAEPSRYDNGKADVTFRPITPWPSSTRLVSSTDKMVVPASALKKGEEHVYSLNVGVEQFGLSNLWHNPITFKVKFMSAIAYMKVTPDKDVYEIGYPGKTLTLDDANFSAPDPKYGNTGDVNILANRDSRIKSVDVKIAKEHEGFRNLFAESEVTSSGTISIKTAEGIESAQIPSVPIKFNLVITDKFGNTVEHPFNVKIKGNEN